jgi:hypothetical protein
MTLCETFEHLAGEWAEHCRRVSYSSNTWDYLDHPAFHQIAELGPGVLHLVMARYEADDLVPWEFVLERITGTRMIADPDVYSPGDVRRRWLDWWNWDRDVCEPITLLS